MNNFLKTWYRSEIRPDQILDAFNSWLNAKWGDATPSLVFTRPPAFTPWVRRTVEVADANGETIELRFEIDDGLADPWYETVAASDLPRVVAEFLQVDDPQELIYIDLGSHIRWWERLH